MRFSWCVIVLAACSLSAQAAPGQQNLVDLYQLALSSDPTWAAAKNAHLAAQEKLEQGKSLYLPTVSANSNASHSETDIRYMGSATVFRNGGRESFDTFGYGVSVSQPIYRKQISAQFAQAKSQVSQADKELVLARQTLMLRISQAYFDTLQAQDRLDLISAQKSAISGQLEQARANFEAGTATITDVNEAQARYDLLKAQEIASLNDMEVKRRTLQAIIGQQPAIRLASAMEDLHPASPDPADMEAWVTMAEQNNLNVLIQQQVLDIATQEIYRQQAGHLPTLDAVGNYTGTRASGGINGFGTDLQNATIGVQLQIPLYQGGLVNSRVREAVANKNKALDDLEAARRQAELDTRQAYLTLVSSIAQVHAYEQALSSSQSQLDSTNLGYEVGVRNSVDVLNAQQQLFSAKRDLLQARYNYLLGMLKLKSATGQLSDADMITVNQHLASGASVIP
ncbi:TolC family outer membrane protein [Methylovorus glucosotrophus]|uniref:Type I secretion outer membrane protein, TolC family n=1 Tax=Methylovorus glucosotrophus (strain SIP3-4) TaxID=582744 RepID=C6XB95_METGS|nr:TolC family outer membrane protein [Methylovorus glucosotrophus]ACT51865.1 type I secretion outer membrane protein, TolC family [Methylovorus glucosotrophus SIP3-4]